MSALHRGDAELNKIRTATADAHRQAKHEYERAQIGAVDLLAPLREYDEGVAFKKPGFEADPARHRALTVALARQLCDNPDLVLTTLGAAKVRVDDLGPQRRLREATEAAMEASRAYSDFRREHASEFAAEAKAAEQKAVQHALAQGDPEAIRTALGLREDKSSVLTTADLVG